MLFIEEHGCIHPKASLLLDLPYEQIRHTKWPETQLEITTNDGAKQYVTPLVPTEIESSLEKLLFKARSKAVNMLLH